MYSRPEVLKLGAVKLFISAAKTSNIIIISEVTQMHFVKMHLFFSFYLLFLGKYDQFYFKAGAYPAKKSFLKRTLQKKCGVYLPLGHPGSDPFITELF